MARTKQTARTHALKPKGPGKDPRPSPLPVASIKKRKKIRRSEINIPAPKFR
jgi:hypothetical protein